MSDFIPIYANPIPEGIKAIWKSYVQSQRLSDNEVFVPIQSAKGYWVSNFGRVFSEHSGKILKFNKVKSGYLMVSFGKKISPRTGEKVADHRLVHRVVASVFHINPKCLPEVDHIDGDKTNNCSSNLRWVTKQENTTHAKARGAYTGPKTKPPEGMLIRIINGKRTLIPAC